MKAFTYTGTDDFTGNHYAFDLENVYIHDDFEKMGPAIEATIVTPKGRFDILEWVENGRVARGSPDSNISVNCDSDVADLFGFERPAMAPVEAYIPDALFDALQGHLPQ